MFERGSVAQHVEAEVENMTSGLLSQHSYLAEEIDLGMLDRAQRPDLEDDQEFAQWLLESGPDALRLLTAPRPGTREPEPDEDAMTSTQRDRLRRAARLTTEREDLYVARRRKQIERQRGW
jgi:hypothetical protein